MVVLISFYKDKILSPYGWDGEYLIDFFDVLGDDPLIVVEEIKKTGNMPRSFNSTFLSLITKVIFPGTFDESIHISL